MKDPVRWRDDPGARPARADALLRGTRRPRPPRPGELDRLRGAVATMASASASASARVPPARHRWRVAAAVVLASGTMAVAGGLLVKRGRPAAVTAIVAAPPSVPAEVAAAPAPAPLPAPSRPVVATAAPARRAPVAHAARRVTAAPAVTADSLARETALIDAARRDLRAEPSRALAALELHRREFPGGQLAAERELLAVESLQRLGRTTEARRRATALAARFPSSRYAARAARLLEADDVVPPASR
jgi:hypothetical protein